MCKGPRWCLLGIGQFNTGLVLDLNGDALTFIQDRGYRAWDIAIIQCSLSQRQSD